MSAPPYMPLYVADYLADTTHLTQAENGAYLLLLMAMWRNGGWLPADDAKLAKFSRSTPPQWARIKDTILEFFDISHGQIKQPRLAAELAKYEAVTLQKSRAGKKSAEARSLKNNDTRPTAAQRPLNEPEPEPEPYVSETKVSSTRALAKPDEFEAFWEIWPDKRSKGAARRAYPSARRKASQADILAAVPRVTETRAWMSGNRVHASTWLNDERWNDPPEDHATGPPPSYSPSQLQAASDELAFRMAKDELARRNNERNPGVVVPLPEARQIGRR